MPLPLAALFDWQNKEPVKVTEKSVFLVPISMSKPCFRNIQLTAIVNGLDASLNACEEATVIFIVVDSLYNYTLQISEADPLRALKDAIDMGDSWYKNSKGILKKFKSFEKISGKGMPAEVLRWKELFPIGETISKASKEEELKYHQKFIYQLERIQKFYQDDVFSKEMDLSIDDFLKKYPEKKRVVSQERARELCRKYLEEEFAGYLVLFDKTAITNFCYPFSQNPEGAQHIINCLQKLLSMNNNNVSITDIKIDENSIKQNYAAEASPSRSLSFWSPPEPKELVDIVTHSVMEELRKDPNMSPESQASFVGTAVGTALASFTTKFYSHSAPGRLTTPRDPAKAKSKEEEIMPRRSSLTRSKSADAQ